MGQPTTDNLIGASECQLTFRFHDVIDLWYDEDVCPSVTVSRYVTPLTVELIGAIFSRRQ